MKLLVIKAITQACTGNSVKQQQHADICAVAEGLEFGRKLHLTILTGGLCNYSYKVSFVTNKDEQNQKQQQDGDDVALFAKLTFKKAVGLGPDVPDCSHDRTQCEYDMLEMFAKVSLVLLSISFFRRLFWVTKTLRLLSPDIVAIFDSFSHFLRCFLFLFSSKSENFK